MATTLNYNQFIITVPQGADATLRDFVKSMGWTMRKANVEHKKHGLDLALEDVKAGKVNEYKSAEELFAKLGI